MDDLNKQDVNTGDGATAPGAAVGTDQTTLQPDQAALSDTAAKPEGDKPAGDVPAEVVDEPDFEAVLFTPDEPKGEEGGDKAKKEEESGSSSSDATKPSALSDRLKTLKEIAAQLDAVPENQDANFNRLRKLNREMIKEQIGKVESLEKLEAYGSPERVEQALSLLDGLNGYDTERGVPSAHKFAESLHQQNPEVAYNAALNLMRFSSKDGKPFAELFTRNVLGLDPARLADFQAISKGEIPEGYEGMAASPDEIAAIEPQFHDAFKRLTPKQKEIVKDGYDQYATQTEKAEAVRVLQDSQKVIGDEKGKAEKKAQDEASFVKNLETKATEIEGQSTETIGTRIQSGLEKLVFSSDTAVDMTMKQAVNNQIFNLVNDSPYIRKTAENYFTAMGVDITAQRPKIDYLFGRLSENIDIETVATLRGQTKSAEEAHRVRVEAENRLAAIGLSLIAQVARRTKAGLAAKGAVKLPENQLPAVTTTSSEGQPSAAFDYKAAAAATREGKTLKAA
jgi:hypothetical protein